jgi:hypothetical protein
MSKMLFTKVIKSTHKFRRQTWQIFQTLKRRKMWRLGGLTSWGPLIQQQLSGRHLLFLPALYLLDLTFLPSGCLPFIYSCLSYTFHTFRLWPLPSCQYRAVCTLQPVLYPDDAFLIQYLLHVTFLPWLPVFYLLHSATLLYRVAACLLSVRCMLM